ncbi:MAG: hypothetical protein M0D53_12785 [Flavobacterium sp. JAD_PAG50586_2]|nr:MAG: hypothetical protein M0D53_12785 [Flavobacterium sp. JAD_PAG50586_2]
MLGDSDYEYIYTVEPEEATKFYKIYEIKDGDKCGLLQSIKGDFSVEDAYSLFGQLIIQHLRGGRLIQNHKYDS